ncbi:MAG: ASKHA domain-containing protein [Oscillospiraceae bacterium]
MKSFKITFLPSGLEYQAKEGSTVLQAMIDAGLTPDAPCGGKGICGKCRVSVVSGEPHGSVLACQTHIHGEMLVDTLQKEKNQRILDNGCVRSVAVNPYPTAAHKPGLPHWTVGVDIGTTTIVGYLMCDGVQIAAKSMMNPQIKYGADVISRANYVLENGDEGQTALSEAVRKALNTIVCQVSEQAGISARLIEIVAIVGNTCMHHLFMGLLPDTLVHAPYVPRMSEACVLDPSDYGIAINPDGKLLWFPNIAGFVGGDTVGCLVASDFDKIEKMTLMIDIGTNGELVLGNRERRISCSTAAGPAFEGAKITCGMRGASGAIDHFKFDGDAPVLSTIDAQKPQGICGSGLMDIIASLVETGFIDGGGRLLECGELTTLTARKNAFRLEKIDGMPSFVLAFENETGTDKRVYLTQRDIREVQLAKAAIAAGIKLLADELGTELEDIESVLIAGAFGNYMNPHSACAIGLIPRELEQKIHPIGNAAGEGAKLAAISAEEFEHAKRLAKTTGFLELASKPQFQDCFVDELEFFSEE